MIEGYDGAILEYLHLDLDISDISISLMHLVPNYIVYENNNVEIVSFSIAPRLLVKDQK